MNDSEIDNDPQSQEPLRVENTDCDAPPSVESPIPPNAPQPIVGFLMLLAHEKQQIQLMVGEVF